MLVGFSTTFQNQADVLARVIQALSGLDVRGVVTLGPALEPGSLPGAPNVHLCASAPHSELLREASAVVTHAGHGTVIRSLAAGVPLVCMPMGRDQNDNAARVVARDAGVRLSPTASVAAIRRNLRDVLESGRYREGARLLGARIASDAETSPALCILEEIAGQRAGVGRG